MDLIGAALIYLIVGFWFARSVWLHPSMQGMLSRAPSFGRALLWFSYIWITWPRIAWAQLRDALAQRGAAHD